MVHIQMVVKTIRNALQRRILDSNSIGLQEDEVYKHLAVKRRRELIRHLAHDFTDSESVQIGKASMYIACMDNDKIPEEVTSDERKAAYISLYQEHLPKLDDAGVVEWDRRVGSIQRGEDIDALAQLLGEVERACGGARHPTAALGVGRTASVRGAVA